MTKKMEISKQVLEEYYLIKGFSSRRIAEQLKCDHGVILRRLREYKIPVKKPKIKIIIPKEELNNLYSKEGLSAYKIAKKFELSSCSVYSKLKEAGILTRPKKVVKISKEKLEDLYLNKNLSCSKIAKKFHCNHVTIFQKLKDEGIPRRNAYLSNTIYPKKKFDGSDSLKAYMIGFRLGDLNVKSKDKNATIMVKSNTTKEEQCKLIEQVYGIYGHYKCKARKDGQYCMWINLDKSFSFLIPKQDKIEEWIFNNNNNFFSFLAGYTDAEGNFSISGGSARFRIRTYDKNILLQISQKLNNLGIKAIFGLASQKGTYSKRKQNQDCWGTYVYAKKDLLRLLQILKPLLKHEKRYNDLIIAEKNILERNKKLGIE